MLPAVEIPILAILAEGNRHGYEINRELASSGMQRWMSVSKVAVYKALARLEAAGYLTSSAERVGNAPERIVYGITSEGRERLRDLLYGLLSSPESLTYATGLGLHFLVHLPRQEALLALSTRLYALEGTLRRLEKEQEVLEDLAEPLSQMLLEHDVARYRLEIAWLERVCTTLAPDREASESLSRE
jgi:DNA-binding PadR family transcriptional regulator